MAIQTAAQLKAAFGAGKFPTAQNWEDLIDSMFASGGTQTYNYATQIYSFHQSVYASSVPSLVNPSTNSVVGNVYDGQDGYNISDVVPVGVFMSDKFIPKEYTYNFGLEERVGKEPFILIIHNNGVAYNYFDGNGEMYIGWGASAQGEAKVQGAAGKEPRYFEYKNGDYVSKTKVAVVPYGCSIAFSYTELGGFQPIGNFTSVDYDTFIQQQSN